jgi:hypothetical protein
MIIAVDFDGVLSIGDYKFPYIGTPNTTIFKIISDLKKEGHKIILWTCRENTEKHGNALDSAVEWCEKHGLVFDAINDNVEEMKERYGHNSRKIYADKYIDDKAWNPNTDCSSYLYNLMNLTRDIKCIQKDLLRDFASMTYEERQDELQMIHNFMQTAMRQMPEDTVAYLYGKEERKDDKK